MVYLPTFTKNINQMQVNVPYMDGMGDGIDQKRKLVVRGINHEHPPRSPS